MEAELNARYVTCLECDVGDFALFYIDHSQNFVMYQTDPPRPFTKYASTSPIPINTSNMIPVYLTNHSPQTKEELAKVLDNKHYCLEESCGWHPPRSVSLLEQVDEPEIQEITPPFEPMLVVKGYMETCWSYRTCSTPPPYVKLDDRRRATHLAYINPDDLPISPPPYSADQTSSLEYSPTSQFQYSSTSIPLPASPGRPRAFQPAPGELPELAELPVSPVLNEPAEPVERMETSTEEETGGIPPAVLQESLATTAGRRGQDRYNALRVLLRPGDRAILDTYRDCPSCQLMPCQECYCDCPSDHAYIADLSLTTSRLPQ